MGDPKHPKTPKKQPTGNYDSGYARPPVSGQIKPGEVRNPHGRRGSPKERMNPLEKIMNQHSRVTIDGEIVSMSNADIMLMQLMRNAQKGHSGSVRVLLKEAAIYWPSTNPVLSQQEQADQEADVAQRKELSAKMIGMLNDIARYKKAAGMNLDRSDPNDPAN